MSNRGKKRARTPNKWPQNVHYSVTFNNPVIDGFGDRCNHLKGSEYYFLKGQFENADTTGRLHFQCYFYTKKPKSYKATKDWLRILSGDPSPHVIPINSREHFDNVFPYVHKDATCADISCRIEVGCELPEYLLTGGDPPPDSLSTVGDDDPLTRNRQVWLFHGPKHTGKSTAARVIGAIIAAFLEEDGTVYMVGAATLKHRWLGAYSGQPVAVIDEFSDGQFDANYCKMLLDRAPQTLTTTGGGNTAVWIPGLIILCNNWDREERNEFLNYREYTSRVTWAKYMDTSAPHWKKSQCMITDD